MKFSDAIQKFSTWRQFKVKASTVKGYDKELRTLCLFLRNPEIEEISIADVMSYLQGMKELGWQNNSFIPKCMALRKFFEFFRLQGYRVLDPKIIPIPSKELAMPRVLAEETYVKLLSVIPANNDPRHIRNRAIISLLWDTGARNGEVLSLNTTDLDFERMRATLRTEKSRGRRPFREVFWTSQTNGTLAGWLEKRKTLNLEDADALFVSASGSNVGRRFTIKGVGEMLRRYCNKAEIQHVNAHSFRHHLGHEIIHKGGSAADVMNILGHSSIASSTVYTMMNDRELEDRYRKIKGT